MKQPQFPNANRRQPNLIHRIGQLSGHARREELGLQNAPNPDVRVEKQLQSRPASQSSRLPVGPTMSPKISAVPAMQPNQLFGCSSGVGGTISADRKSTRLNSSHSQISYAVFCLKKKKKI